MTIARAQKHATTQPIPQAGQRRALVLLLGEYEQAQRESAEAAERVARFETSIRLLIENLPSEDRAEFIRRFDELRYGTSTPRAGEVVASVVALFQKRPQQKWTVPEIQSELESTGGAPEDPKALYNAVNYLAKTGRLRRVSRGRYVAIDYGFGIEDEDRDDGTVRLTEHDT